MINVNVLELCRFTARQGDLDHRYTPAPSAAEGIKAHRLARHSRPQSYQPEFHAQGTCCGLTISGRADGFDPNTGMVEEIKSHRGSPERINPGKTALHRAQLRTYGALIGRAHSLVQLPLKLTYVDIDSGVETSTSEIATVDSLWQELEDKCRLYIRWAHQEAQHREKRDQYLTNIQLPFSGFRTGQRSLSEAVYKTVANRRRALIQAPTGIGKTVGTLYPAMVAMPRHAVDRLFFLTVRNTGRQLALDALERMFAKTSEPQPVRILVHCSKEQACEFPDRACNGESCPLAKGFYDRLPACRQQALDSESFLYPEHVREIALNHGICPYYLSQELARWCDLIIGDVNYYFDQQALLYGLTVEEDWKVTVLVDEAHNLVNRARDMYSVSLSRQTLSRVKRTAPGPLKKSMDTLNRHWRTLLSEHPDSTSQLLNEVPAKFCRALQRLTHAITDYLTEQPGSPELQQLLFESLAFLNLAEAFAEHSICRLTRDHQGTDSLEIRNLVPADFLSTRFDAAHSCVLFSATLAPFRYYRDLLGMPAETLWLDVESPFSKHQLQVRMVPSISTRLDDRAASILPTVRRVVRQYRENPANYLVYVSSFAYLEALYDGFTRQAPDLPLQAQSRSMSETARQQYVDSFTEDGAQVGLAVLGGAFSEGIDLPGSRLTGVFVLTLGLPPHDELAELLRNRLEHRFGQGYNYTYLYPGIQKVIQAAGRLIRTPEDAGVIELIDPRFTRPEIRALLPNWWPTASTCD
jgi:DNA excision repair protein ERCC-2